jgi:hypothetical protein
VLISRSWHRVSAVRVKPDGTCQYCGAKIAGHFEKPSFPTGDVKSLRKKVEALQGTDRVV